MGQVQDHRHGFGGLEGHGVFHGPIGPTKFSPLDASGSTSQAANIAEALEAGSRVLLMDEDTSATNFMVRDELMQAVIARDRDRMPFQRRLGLGGDVPSVVGVHLHHLVRDVEIGSAASNQVTDTDISLFINHLPSGRDTTKFSTLDASGSTSQAANIAEALEAGARRFSWTDRTHRSPGAGRTRPPRKRLAPAGPTPPG